MNINFLAALAACVLAPALAQEAQVELVLQVQSQANQLWADVRLVNRATRPVLVPRDLATEDELTGRLFDIRDAATGVALDYQGMMVKRGPLTEEDFLQLAPGTSQHNRIELSRSYAFPSGRHTYTISYAGHYRQEGREVPLTAAPVPFEHDAQ